MYCPTANLARARVRHVEGREGIERVRGRRVLVAEQPHDDRQRDALLVEVHGLGLAEHVAVGPVLSGIDGQPARAVSAAAVITFATVSADSRVG